MEQDRAILLLQKLEGLDERGNVVAIDWTIVFQPQLLEYDAGPKHAFGDFLGFTGHAQRDLPTHLFHELSGAIVQVVVLGAGHDLIQVAGDRTHVLVDGPFVIVQHHHHALGVVGDVVQCFIGNPASESGVSGHGDDVFLASSLVAGYGHAKSRRKGCARVSGAVTVVRALRTQHEAVQAAWSSDGVEPLPAAGEQFVHVGLMADVKQEMVRRSGKHIVQGDGEFHHAEIGAEVAAIIGEDGNQLLPYFQRQFFQVGDLKPL